MLSRSQALSRCLRSYPLGQSVLSTVPSQSLKRWTTSSSSETVRAAENPSQHRSLSIMSASDLVSAAPSYMRPYLQLMRLDKPTGTWLLFWPCTWSIALATPAGQLPSLYYLMLFGVGSVLMRGAGCVINDLFDKDFDKRVERTKMRPLACGSLTQRQAIYFLGGLLSTSLAVLMQLNWFSVAVGSASMLLVVVYPLAKRYTYWPQFVLEWVDGMYIAFPCTDEITVLLIQGATLNWGVLIAWAEMLPQEQFFTVLPLYFSTVLHTVIYDTIYSHQDKADDIMIGVKSTALRFGEKTKLWLSGFGSAAVAGLGLAGHLADQTWPYYFALAATSMHLGWQIGTLNIDDGNDCWEKFRSNQWLGAILFAGIVAGNFIREEEKTDMAKDAKDDSNNKC